MKVGIISDTHDLLRPEVIEALQGCDTILHAGDISSQRILGQLEQIAKKHKLDPELVEQIVRLYVTHPGVTVDGIMTKMGLLGKL